MCGPLLLIALAAAAPSRRDEPTVLRRYELRHVELGASQSRAWPGSLADDRGFRLGGIFSGLCHAAGDPEDVFTCVADRGPNEEIEIGAERRRTFPVPGYSPLIYRVRVEADTLRILDQVGIRTRGGEPVTGIPNAADDEAPYAFDGTTRLALDPDGLDVEGIAVAPDGTFWIADEYRPSLAHVARDGTVLARLVPRGVTLAADTDVRPVLPEILARRRLNRGFEGVALSPDGSRLFALMESPLEFPDREVGRASRMIRIVVVDPLRMTPIAEHVYVADSAKALGESEQGQIRLSDVACVDSTTLLIVERGQTHSRIYRVDLGRAVDILGTPWDDPAHTGDALESLTPARLRARGVAPARKSLLVDLARLSGVPSKIEGLAIVNATTLAVGNDDDFGFSGVDAGGRAQLSGARSSLTLVRLPRPLSSTR